MALPAAHDGVRAQPVAGPACDQGRRAVRIGHSDDFGWAIAEATHPAVDPQAQPRWADVAAHVFQPERSERRDVLLAAADDSTIAARFRGWLEPMRIDGPEATRARALLRQQREWEAEEAGWAQAQQPDPAAVQIALALDRDDAWAGTGFSLVIGGFRHLQITTRPVPALKHPVQIPG